MIIFRQKIFGSFQDGFKGKRGDIARSKKKSDSYKKFGPWQVDLSDLAQDDLLDFKDQTYDKIQKILKELETKPYQGNFGQHPLWEFYDKTQDCVIWSAEITEKDRITYLIFKFQNYILVTNIGGHRVIDMEYSVRPKL